MRSCIIPEVSEPVYKLSTVGYVSLAIYNGIHGGSPTETAVGIAQSRDSTSNQNCVTNQTSNRPVITNTRSDRSFSHGGWQEAICCPPMAHRSGARGQLMQDAHTISTASSDYGFFNPMKHSNVSHNGRASTSLSKAQSNVPHPPSSQLSHYGFQSCPHGSLWMSGPDNNRQCSLPSEAPLDLSLTSRIHTMGAPHHTGPSGIDPRTGTIVETSEKGKVSAMTSEIRETVIKTTSSSLQSQLHPEAFHKTVSEGDSCSANASVTSMQVSWRLPYTSGTVAKSSHSFGPLISSRTNTASEALVLLEHCESVRGSHLQTAFHGYTDSLPSSLSATTRPLQEISEREVEGLITPPKRRHTARVSSEDFSHALADRKRIANVGEISDTFGERACEHRLDKQGRNCSAVHEGGAQVKLSPNNQSIITSLQSSHSVDSTLHTTASKSRKEERLTRSNGKRILGNLISNQINFNISFETLGRDQPGGVEEKLLTDVCELKDFLPSAKSSQELLDVIRALILKTLSRVYFGHEKGWIHLEEATRQRVNGFWEAMCSLRYGIEFKEPQNIIAINGKPLENLMKNFGSLVRFLCQTPDHNPSPFPELRKLNLGHDTINRMMDCAVFMSFIHPEVIRKLSAHKETFWTLYVRNLGIVFTNEEAAQKAKKAFLDNDVAPLLVCAFLVEMRRCNSGWVWWMSRLRDAVTDSCAYPRELSEYFVALVRAMESILAKLSVSL